MTRRETRVDQALARRREQRDRIELDDDATDHMSRALDTLNHPPTKETP